jgi:hypothetical protein
MGTGWFGIRMIVSSSGVPVLQLHAGVNLVMAPAAAFASARCLRRLKPSVARPSNRIWAGKLDFPCPQLLCQKPQVK